MRKQSLGKQEETKCGGRVGGINKRNIMKIQLEGKIGSDRDVFPEIVSVLKTL